MTPDPSAIVARPVRGWLAAENHRVGLAAAAIAVAAGVAYFNSLNTPFVFDDIRGIVDNTTIRHLWPIWDPLSPPHDGSSAAGRPLVNLSLALNYAFGGTAVFGYHLVNLLIHLACGLVLFGIVRRTLLAPVVPEGLRASALPLGFATALLWVLHPLQTESVTFVIQRTESLGSLAYLATLYCFIRGTDPTTTRPRGWLAGSVAACWAGVFTKEIIVTAPVIVLLYDRTFVAGTWTEAWRKRRGWHAALAASWALLAVVVWQAQGRGGTVGFDGSVGPWISLLTQCQAVAMYLKLAVWPHPLVVDYGEGGVTRLTEVLPQALFLTSLASATLYAVIKRPALGFVGAWFFLILAPSSSVVPLLSQRMAEHRMYLPLAAVVVLVVIGLHRLGRRTAWLACGVIALAFGAATVARNRDYRTALALWTDTVEKRPSNHRAHYNHGLELANLGDTAEAMREYEEALRLSPNYVDAHMNLAALLLAAGQLEAAHPHVEAAYRLAPTSASAINNAGFERYLLGDLIGAGRYFETAVRLNPENAEAHNNLGFDLAARGMAAEAIGEFRRSLELNPSLARAHQNLGKALLLSGHAAEARASLETAVQLQPGNGEAQLDLGSALVTMERFAEAVPHFQTAARINPGDFRAHFNLGVALARSRRTAEAIQSIQDALRLEPGNPLATDLLATLRGRQRE